MSWFPGSAMSFFTGVEIVVSLFHNVNMAPGGIKNSGSRFGSTEVSLTLVPAVPV